MIFARPGERCVGKPPRLDLALLRFKLAADFPLLEPRMLRRLDDVLERDVPALLEAFGNPFDRE